MKLGSLLVRSKSQLPFSDLGGFMTFSQEMPRQTRLKHGAFDVSPYGCYCSSCGCCSAGSAHWVLLKSTPALWTITSKAVPTCMTSPREPLHCVGYCYRHSQTLHWRVILAGFGKTPSQVMASFWHQASLITLSSCGVPVAPLSSMS